jgi:hypothetical protein
VIKYFEMKRSLNFLFLFLLMMGNLAIGQSQRPGKHNHPSGKQSSISLGANLPLGNFSSTHISGIATNYSWSNHRFGRMDVKPVKPFGFTANTGVAYYFGKKEIVSSYQYKYPGYIFIHTYAGTIYNGWRKANISLTAGPALGIYNGNTQFHIGSILEGSYFINEKIAITPGIHFMKESGVDPLWSASLKATMAF